VANVTALNHERWSHCRLPGSEYLAVDFIKPDLLSDSDRFVLVVTATVLDEYRIAFNRRYGFTI